jgi:hypothetical protein
MPGALSGIMGGLGKLGGALGTGGEGGGLLSAISPITSIMGLVNQYSLASKEKAAMDRANYLSKHPEAVSAMVAQATKPLSSGLTSSVSNVVNANLAEQGLSQAPNIQAQVLSQSLAPYQQNEQAMALQQVLRTLGLPMEALAGIQSVQQNPASAGGLWGALGGSQPGTFGGGSVGGHSDPLLGQIGAMPSSPFGVYGPDLAAPDPGSIGISNTPNWDQLPNLGG